MISALHSTKQQLRYQKYFKTANYRDHIGKALSTVLT